MGVAVELLRIGSSMAGASMTAAGRSSSGVLGSSVASVANDSSVPGLPSLAGSSLVSRVFTDRHGRFSLMAVQPGTYSVEAMATAFLPALRQNLKIRGNTVVNLTLSTLFEAAQWLPVEKRSGNQPSDDWTWTLRSSANRPLLRMLASGPLVLVEDGSAAGESNGLAETQRVAANRTRVTASGGTGAFGEGNLRSTFELQHASDETRQLIFRTQLSAGGTAAFESVAAYRRELTPGHTMRTVLAVQDESQLHGEPGVEGMQSLILRSSESLKLTDHLVADAGNEFQAIKLGRMSIASHPFGGLTWNDGDNSVSYRVATSRTAQQSDSIDAAASMLLPVSIGGGALRVEHGLHQQASLERKTARLQMRVAAFHDHLLNPVVEGGGSVTAANAESGNLLLDQASGLVRVTGQSYRGTGAVAEARGRLGSETWITIECADGPALSLGAVPASSTMLAALNALRRRNVQVYSIAMSGQLNGTGTRWRTSYRWQPGDTVTPVAPFESSPEAAYLSIFLRQPVHLSRILPNGVDAVVDLRNLLAEGYRPFVTMDGSTLYLAQTERSIQGGLSFSF